ncbi:MAG: alanine racemase [Lachnospiraceae bacterium]|nr:alanine racemase [Lachnospiraceae bacterium]
MKIHRRVCATIDLDAITENVKQLHNNIGQSQLMVVVKANGYGHGLLKVAQHLTKQALDFLWGFGVATLGEAVELRKGGIQTNIIVLGCVFLEQYKEMIAYDIIPTVYTYDMAKEMSQLAVEAGEMLRIHIKLDTGMGRLGFLPTEESLQAVKQIFALPNLNVDGIFTHFARADEPTVDFTKTQYEIYKKFLASLGKEVPFYHCNNSAGVLAFPQFSNNLVRAGLSVYGFYSSDEVERSKVRLKPALRLTSHVTFVKEVPKGTPISYGSTFVTPKKMQIATIPVGYGDGYPRSLSNIGEVLIGGKRCRILGRICMDQFMVDVSHLPDVQSMDLVVLVGKMGKEEIHVDELSKLSNRFNYEFLCCLGNRIPRKYKC